MVAHVTKGSFHLPQVPLASPFQLKGTFRTEPFEHRAIRFNRDGYLFVQNMLHESAKGVLAAPCASKRYLLSGQPLPLHDNEAVTPTFYVPFTHLSGTRHLHHHLSWHITGTLSTPYHPCSADVVIYMHTMHAWLTVQMLWQMHGRTLQVVHMLIVCMGIF